jgi:hypothetical protein
VTEPAPNDKTGLAAIAIAALAVACCAGGPLLVAVVGSLAAGALIGIAAAVTLLLVACAAVHARHRPAKATPRSRP